MGASISATPSIDFDFDLSPNLFIDYGAILSNDSTSTQPIINVPAGESLSLALHLGSQVLSNAAVPLFNVAAGAEFSIFTYGSVVQNNQVTGAGEFDFIYDVPSLAVSGLNQPPLTTAASYDPSQSDDSPQLSGVLNFVLDCGADPSGITSSSAALVKAGALLVALAANPKLVANAVTLYLPPGNYLIDGAGGGVWNFEGLTTTVRIQGCGDASVFILNQCSFGIADIANAYRIEIQDFAIWGATNDNVTADAAFAFDCNAIGGETLVRRVRFIYTIFSLAVLYLSNEAHVQDCDFAICSAPNASYGMIYSDTGTALTVERCRFVDIAALNGFVQVVSKVAANGSYIHANASLAPPQAQNRGIRISQCFFDEGSQNHIFIDGTAGATTQITSVVIEQNFGNTPINAGAFAAIHVQNVLSAKFYGLVGTNVTGNVTIPWIELLSVERTTIDAMNISATANANYITADVNCGVVRVTDSPNLIAANIRSSAALTEVEENFSGIVANGTPVTLDTAILTGTVVRIKAWVDLVSPAASLLTANLIAEGVYKNLAGTVTFPAPVTGSTNPMNSNTAAYAVAAPLVSELNSVGGAPSTAGWSVSGTDMRLTLTNSEASSSVYYQAKTVRKIYAPAT